LDGRQILGSFVIGTVACAWALRRIARRPGDEQQRRDRARAIVAAWGVLVSGLLLLVALMIATYLADSNCGGMMGSVASLAIYPLGLLALLTLAWSLFTVVAPRAARRRPSSPSASTPPARCRRTNRSAPSSPP
jgi:membrane protein implicated in regulation of membrane protease activity